MFSKANPNNSIFSKQLSNVSSSQVLRSKFELISQQLPHLKGSEDQTSLDRKPKITHPTEAGYVNLRIKSSKAFPMDEVKAIE